MDIKDLIIGLMASLGKSEYSVEMLCALTTPFHVSQNALRTALSRLKTKKWLDSYRKDNKAYYFFCKKGLFKRTTIARSFISPDWSDWDDFFWGFFYSVPGDEKEERYRIRKKLEVFHFASFFPGFWIRPRHLDDHFIEELSSIQNSNLIVFKNHKSLSIEKIDSLWGLKEINKVFKQDVLLLTREIDKDSIKPVNAFIRKMEIGDRIVNHLFKDPLVPPSYWPDDWSGEEVRRLFLLFDRKMTEYSKPFWGDILSKK